ncbi:unnamed protein product [Rotaria sp. Silwood2]|nr:unnamed protein product [Rotaria sp. Silwood2]CAF4419986.1 unnamed protein product [Rotaria sp. Silwood2]CAF4443577.1 unnamed protein product [Rotaria sp. Silwood2]
MELDKQAQSYPLTTLSLDQLDQYLKQFVDCQRKYLSMRNNKHLQKFRDEFHEKLLLETISTFRLNIINLNQYINRLKSIREKQATIYEDLLMLEMRVSCKLLPKNFDQLEDFIASIAYLPLNNDQKMIEVRNKRYKTIQEAKRIWLNIFLNAYEIQLQEYDQEYEYEFLQLESHLLNSINITMKMRSLRGILIKNRQRSSSTKKTVGVWPEPYLDLLTNIFNRYEWNYLSFDSIQRKIKKHNLILRVTDKGYNFYIGADDIPVRPIENTIPAPTTNISNYLDEIIRPIFDKECQSTTIIDGASLIQTLHQYIRKGLFKSSTLFCTFDIHNLYTMLLQEEVLNILVEFLHVHGYTKVKGIHLETIKLLASIVLKENVFVYGKKIYRQVLGGAMGSSFALTLANIFMWKWQKELVHRQDMTGEFYGRLPSLDVLLTNINGTLLTSIYHKPAAEPYVVPFTSDHPRHVFENIVQTSLRRAIIYSSHFQSFDNERRYIKLTLLYNGYPTSFIKKAFGKFFSGCMESTSFLQILHNERQFLQMRTALSGRTSQHQSQFEMRIATVTTDNEHLRQESDKNQELSNKTNQKQSDFQNKLIIHYTHEKRFNTRKKDMHRIFQQIFDKTPVIQTELIVGNRNRQNAIKELIRKRPAAVILKNKPDKGKKDHC